MNREITLSTPKQVNLHTQITGAELSYCYFHDNHIAVYMNGGMSFESLPLDGMTEDDRNIVLAFCNTICRLAGEEVNTGAVKAESNRIRIEKANLKKD